VTSVVIPVAEDERRTVPAICRNAAVVLAALLAFSGLAAAGAHSVTASLCRSTRHDVAAAETRFHAAFGRYSDLPGLIYAGYLTDTPWPSTHIRLAGSPASSYSLQQSALC
jgi:hypothetical protein